MKERKNDPELQFVLQHYEEKRFSPEEAQKRLERPARRQPWRRWAAVAASLLCLTMLASVLLHQTGQTPTTTSQSDTAAKTTVVDTQAIVSFHFDDTPLPQVLAALEQHYAVPLTASDTTRRLTGHFQGETLDEIVAMIEEVLDVSITQSDRP